MTERMPRADVSAMPLSDLAKRVGVSYHTVWQWATVGRKGVKLRTCQHPLGTATTMEEYQLFLERLTEAVEAGHSD